MQMIDTLKKWYQRHLGREESVILVTLLIGSVVLLGVMGDVLTPVFIALILAYLMQGVADQFEKWGLERVLRSRARHLSLSVSFWALCWALHLGLASA